MNRSSIVMAVVYAAGGTVLLALGRDWNGFPLRLMGAGCLLLAALQSWITIRKTGPDKMRYTLLLGPMYALFAAGWLYEGWNADDGLHVGFGLSWAVIAVLSSVRTFRTLRDEQTDR